MSKVNIGKAPMRFLYLVVFLCHRAGCLWSGKAPMRFHQKKPATADNSPLTRPRCPQDARQGFVVGCVGVASYPANPATIALKAP